MEKREIRPPPSENAWTDAIEIGMDIFGTDIYPDAKLHYPITGILPHAYAKLPVKCSIG